MTPRHCKVTSHGTECLCADILFYDTILMVGLAISSVVSSCTLRNKPMMSFASHDRFSGSFYISLRMF